MATAKSSAAQTQLGIGQMQLAVFGQIAKSAEFVVQQAAESRKQAANIWQGMVSTAQDAKKMEIDSYLKSKELDLRGQQIAVDARLTDMNIGFKQAGLSLDERKLQIDQERLNLDREKIERADKNKDYISTASKLGASKLSKGRLDYSAIDSRYKSLVDRKGKLTASERLVLGPEIDKELSSLTERRSNIEREIQEGELYQQEALMVSAGAEPGSVIKLPGYTQPSATSVRNPSMPEGGGMQSNNPLFPSIDASGVKEADKALQELGLEPLSTPSNNTRQPDTLTGQKPNLEFYAPPSNQLSQQDINRLNSVENPIVPFDPEFGQPAKPTFSRDQILGTLATIEDDKVEQEAPSVIALADTETKAYLASTRSNIEQDFLLSIGSMTNYDNANRPDDAINYIKNTMLDYARNGGNQYGIAALQRESKSQISTIRAELLTAKDDAGKPKYSYVDGKPGPDFDAALATKYNEWVLNRGKKVEESEQAKKEDAVKTGVLPNGALNPELARQFSQETVLSPQYSIADMQRATAISTGNVNRKKQVDDLEEFRKEFVFDNGPNKGKLKGSFGKFISDNIDKIDPKLGQFDISTPALENFYQQAKQESIQNVIANATGARFEAYKYWRLAKGKGEF